MIINVNIRKLVTVSLLSSISTFTGADDGLAPEINALNSNSDFPSLHETIPPLTQAFITAKPEDRKDGISVGELDVERDTLNKLAREIADNRHDPYDSLLIAQNNKLVFESYFSRGRINLPHPQASATKAYAALAVGRAIQLGYLTMADLNKPVVTFFKGLDEEQLVEGADRITLHHLMSMQSGIRIEREKLRALLKKSEPLKGEKLVQTYLTHSQPISADTQTYLYQSSDPRIAMLVLDAVVPGSANDFIKNELLEKMGINSYYLRDSVSEVAFGAMMTSRNMLKWGTLIINQGKWNGRQLIPEEFISKATGRIAQPVDDDFDFSNFSYGYFFWRTNMEVGNKSYLVKFAWGGGGQYVISIEDLNLVIAITASAKGIEDKTLALIEKRILPTFVLPI